MRDLTIEIFTRSIPPVLRWIRPLLSLTSVLPLGACTLNFNTFLVGNNPQAQCARPYLMVAMVSGLSNDHGRIPRVAITPEGLRPCADLTVDGRLDRGGWAVADIPNVGIAYAYNDGLTLLHGDTDTLRWDRPANDTNVQALDVFPLTHPDGTPLVAFARSNRRFTTDEPQELVLYDAAGAERGRWIRLNGSGQPWPSSLAGLLRGMSADPFDPTRAVTIVSDNSSMGSPAMSVSFFNDDVRSLTAPQGLMPIARMSTVFTTGGDSSQFVWTGGPSLSQQTGVYYLTTPTGDGTGMPEGPHHCEQFCDSYDHAVPDPTNPLSQFAVCSRAGMPGTRVVRLPDCTVVLESTTLGAQWTFRRLGLVR